MVGMCINTLPFRVSLNLSTTVTDFVTGLHRQSGKLMASEQCGLFDIFKWGQVSPETKLFNSLMAYDNFPPSKSKIVNPDITFEPRNGQNFTEYTLTISFVDNGLNLDCHMAYDQAHCDEVYANYLIR
ncbi:hypothetical protein H4R33_007232, partial [Dimargaris cristalligena]